MTPKIILPGKIEHVTDGDTATVEVALKVNVRLLRGDTFELRSKDPSEKALALAAKREFYRLAYEQTTEGEWATGKKCLLEIPITSDNISHLFTLGRILGEIEIDGVNVMTHMLEENLAKPRGGK